MKNKIHYSIQTSCLFDFLVELLNQAVKNDQLNTTFFKIVSSFINTGDFVKFCKDRFNFFFKNERIENNVIYCNDKVDVFFQKCLSRKVSFTETDYCNACHSNESYDRYVINLQINDDNVCSIKEELYKNMLKNFCKTCHSVLDKTFEFQDYVAIKPIFENTEITLSKISDNVDLNEKTFFLASFVRT